MNIYISPWIAIVVVAVIMFFRFLKRGKRRCCGQYTDEEGNLVDCGSLNVKSVHFILLPPEEADLSFPIMSPTAPLPSKIVSWRHPVSTLRWYIFGYLLKGVPRVFVRRAVKVTIRYHKLKKHDHIWIYAEKVDRSAISLLHLRYTKRFKRQEFEMPRMEYQLAILDFVKPLWGNMTPEALKAKMTDTPDLASGLLSDLQNIFWGDSDEPPQS